MKLECFYIERRGHKRYWFHAAYRIKDDSQFSDTTVKFDEIRKGLLGTLLVVACWVTATKMHEIYSWFGRRRKGWT